MLNHFARSELARHANVGSYHGRSQNLFNATANLESNLTAAPSTVRNLGSFLQKTCQKSIPLKKMLWLHLIRECTLIWLDQADTRGAQCLRRSAQPHACGFISAVLLWRRWQRYFAQVQKLSDQSLIVLSFQCQKFIVLCASSPINIFSDDTTSTQIKISLFAAI